MFRTNPRSVSNASLTQLSDRPAGRPRVSVVFNSSDVVHDATLSERSLHWKKMDVEVVIVSTDHATTSGHSFSDARVVYAPVDSSHTQRRALGLAAASGDLVIMMDATERPDDAWIAQLAGDPSADSSQAQA
jgi:hypothetical protein